MIVNIYSYGKIESLKILDDGAVVAFVEPKSAVKAMDGTVKLHKNTLKMQYSDSLEGLCMDKLQRRSDQR